MKFTYLLVDFFSFVIPFIFSFHPRLKFNKNSKYFLLSNGIVAVCFLIWDAIFTAKGIWGFSNDDTLGIKIFNLPIEEILFFICIPYSCVFTIHCLSLFFKTEWKSSSEKLFTLMLSVLLLTAGLYNLERAYTSATFISTSFLLLLLQFAVKVNWLSMLYSIYPVLLVPFFIVNGILTGTGLEHPVVWYNNGENLGIRLLTIPVEDVVYGFELILLNLFFYEHFKNARNDFPTSNT